MEITPLMWYRTAKISSDPNEQPLEPLPVPQEQSQISSFVPPAEVTPDEQSVVRDHIKESLSTRQGGFPENPKGLAVLMHDREQMLEYIQAEFIKSKERLAAQYGISTDLVGRLIAHVSEPEKKKIPEWMDLYTDQTNRANNQKAKLVNREAEDSIRPLMSRWYQRLMLLARQNAVTASEVARFIPPITWSDIIDEKDEDGKPLYNSSNSSMTGSYFLNSKRPSVQDTRQPDWVDTNFASLGPNLMSLLTANGLANGDPEKNAAKLIAIINQKPMSFISADGRHHGDDPELLTGPAESLRHLYLSYFRGGRLEDFVDLLEMIGLDSLAENFEDHSGDLNYARWFTNGKEEPDKVFGQDYGLSTKSGAEREIMEIFRGFGLTPVPQEVKLQSQVNTSFKLDFLLPCDCLMGFEKNGAPKINSKIIFVGEYFGFYGDKYNKRTSEKEELEPFQAAITNNDVIFIRKNDYSKLRLQQQLDAKGIIYENGAAQKSVNEWLSTGGNKRTNVGKEVSKVLQPQDPDINYIRVAMSQLEMWRGGLQDFYKKYTNDQNFKQVMHDYYTAYTHWVARDTQLRQHLFKTERVMRKLRPDDIQRNQLASTVQELTTELASHSKYYQEKILNGPAIIALREEHKRLLSQDGDYQARLSDLKTLLNMVQSGNTQPILQIASTAEDVSNMPPKRQLRVGIRTICKQATSDVTATGKNRKARIYQPIFGGGITAKTTRGQFRFAFAEHDPELASWLDKVMAGSLPHAL